MKDLESHSRILWGRASDWKEEEVRAFFESRAPTCLHRCVSPTCDGFAAYRRTGLLANFELLLGIRSSARSGGEQARAFWVPYVDAMAHPNTREAVHRSGWRLADVLYEYTDDDADAYITPDSDEGNPRPARRKRAGRERLVRRRRSAAGTHIFE